VLSKYVSVEHAIPDSFIVRLREKPVRFHTLMQAAGVVNAQSMEKGYAAKLSRQAVMRLLGDADVLQVHENGRKWVNPLAGTPTRSWGLDRLDQRENELDGTYDPGSDGAGVVVFIIDTGISPHPDFGGRLLEDVGWTAHGDSWADGHGHGTHVAGTVASLTWGVAKAVKLVAVRVLDSSGSGSDSDVMRGIQFVTAWKRSHPEVDVVANMSLGGGASPALDEEVCNAQAAGVHFAIAAGNESENACKSSPARVIESLTVGATTISNRLASFSNYGEVVDLLAPGQDIQSTQPGGGTATFSGTSMASPHVAGLLALYLARHPGATQEQARDGVVALASVDKIVPSSLRPGTKNLLGYAKE